MTEAVEFDARRLTPQAAAEALFADPHADIDFEPADAGEARAAVEHFAHLFETSSGVLKAMIEGAGAGAETLSVDRLQGLAEIIQNADDAGARHVEFRIVGDALVASHDGEPVRFRDVLGLATPWLTMKAEDVYATGKFGIGLMTLRALSDVLDVHSGPYHFRVGDPTITPIDSSDVHIDADTGATVFVVPVTRGFLDTDALEHWLNRWDDSALLFLCSVKSVSVLSPDGDVVRTLRLHWTDAPDSESVIGATVVAVVRRHAQTTDDRSWLVHSVDVATPTGVHRAWKATGDTVPLGVALPVHHDADGLASAGLPLVAMRTPVRVNAQFDPVANRSDLATNGWNDALLPLLADLWAQSVVDLFAEQPAAAWGVVPLPNGDADEPRDVDSVISRLDALLVDRARTQVPERVTLASLQGDYALSELAVEAPRLAGILTTEEIAQLADAPTTLPLGARDDEERWRDVLSDWRSAGANLPDEVTVAGALVLVENECLSPEATVALTAAGLESDLAGTLATLPCIVMADSSHTVPPTKDSLHALVSSASPLAQELGIGLLLHDAQVADRDDAQMVLEWLRERGALIDETDPQTVVRRLAAAGRAGHRVADVLTDVQVRALRDALETMNGEERSDLGPHIGAAITLDAFTFDSRGKKRGTAARVIDSYLPPTIDKEPDSFAHAARSTPGLVWLHPRYAETLRSSLAGSAGLGARRFLRLLGADLAPRLVPHADLLRRFKSEQLGLGPSVSGSPPERRQEMASKGATYTLDDMDSPDLRAVATNIGEEVRVTHRRKRAAALLGTLDRGWSRLHEHAYVFAADDHFGWQYKGETHAFWLWAVGDIAWLDDTNGVAQRPLNLRLRSAGTVAVHGQDAAGYLREEFDTLSRREVLAALGVRGEPSTRDLVDRLIEVRALPDDDPVVAVDSALVYEALGEHIASKTPIAGDLSDRELRKAFASHDGLVRTQLGWRPPTDVFKGKPIFGARRPFVPQVPNAERLWNLLQIRNPQVDDCRKVLLELARERSVPDGADRSVLLETLRALDDRLAASAAHSTQLRKRLAATPLWTTRGWTKERPVYAVSDPTLVDGLGLHVPVWVPDAELSQFAHLLDPLRIDVLSAMATTVVDGDDAGYDADATEVFRLAVPLLHDDLVRNDPKAAESLHTTWERFGEFEVRTDSELRVTVDDDALTNPITVSVSAKVSSDSGVLYLADPRFLRSADAGGRAVASLFPATDPRQIAQAWLVACVGAADEGRVAEPIASSQEVADEEFERTREQMEYRLATFQQGTAARHADPARRRATSTGGGSGSQPSSGDDGAQPPPPPSRPRVLVDPATLVVADPEGRPGGGPADGSARRPRRSSSGDDPLPDPDLSGHSPRSRTSPASYTPIDKETVGYECFLKVMASDRQEIVDLRGQHGVGADAVDTLDENLYELKVYAQDEPETIRMQESEIRRAHSTPDFFLVIVSNVEGVNARPKVRVIVDPLEQLPMTPNSTVTLSGIRSAEYSQIYDLVPPDDSN